MEDKKLSEHELCAYLTKTRTTLLKEYPFFGYWALQGNIIIHDELPLDCPAMTDGKNYYFSKKQYKDYRDDYPVIFIHEILHNQLDHNRRGDNKIWIVWMLAVDYAINSIIKDKLHLNLPPWVLYDKKFAGHSAEKIYDEILRMIPRGLGDMLMLENEIIDILKKFDLDESRDKGPFPGSSIVPFPGGDKESSTDAEKGSSTDAEKGSSTGGDKKSSTGGDKESSTDAEKGSSTGGGTIDLIWSRLANENQQIYDHLKISPSAKICGRLPDRRRMDPIEMRKIEQMAKKMIIRAAIFERSTSRGNTPGDIERYVDGLLEPKLDLTEVLDIFAYRTGKGMDDYSFSRMKRRETELILPGNVGISKHIVIAIDTSGSIGDEQLKRFLSEASTLSGTTTKITLVCVDAAVYEPLEIAEYEDLYEAVTSNKALRGGGGTDFRGFFDFLNTFSEPTNGVIFFTDGDAFYPDQEKQPNFPVLWIITERRNLDAPPFGETYYLDLGY
ncbi:MAG: VWA-like domain-containing protein [candidate division WOR-3 bacterium]